MSRKGCASSRPKAENLRPFQDTVPVLDNYSNRIYIFLNFSSCVWGVEGSGADFVGKGVF